MAKSNLISEAIADAKQIKATAVANAKIAIEEAFQPTLQRMISTKLSEEDELEDDSFSDEGEVDIDVNSASEEEFAPEGEEDAGQGFGSFEDEEEAPVEDENLELEALIRELEGTEQAPVEEEDEFYNEGEEDDVMSDNPGTEDDMFAENDEYMDDELSEALNALIEEEGLGDDLDLGPNKEDGSAFTDHSLPSGPQFLERRKLRNENKKLKKDLNEAYRAVTTLKKTLNEVNLLNAKLMYTTKTFRQFELNENQQNRILDSFDRANTVREVKLVYTTICEARNKKPIKRMTEGSASKTVKAINPVKKNGTETRANIVEGDIVRWSSDRLQQLANIKKLND